METVAGRLTVGIAALALAISTSCADTERPTPAGVAIEANEEVVRAYVRAVNARDRAALDTLLAEEYVRHSQPRPEATIRSRDDYLRWFDEEDEVFPDAVLELEKLVAEGDHVAFWATYTGRQVGDLGPFRSQGEEVELRYSGMHRVEDGRIAETWITWDNMTAMIQLGHWETRPAGDIRPGEFCAVRIPRDEEMGELAGG